MTGLIWLIQIVHYPSFRFLNPDRFREFHRFHNQSITFIVAPVMLIELFSGALYWYQEWNLFSGLNLLALMLIWMVTTFISVPAHNQLASGHNSAVIERLIRTNWIRTFLWTARSGLMIYILLNILSVEGS